MVQNFTSIDWIEKVLLIKMEIQNCINHMQGVVEYKRSFTCCLSILFFHLHLHARTSTLKGHKERTWLKEVRYNM